MNFSLYCEVVLIVPLWNWNTESLLEIEEVESFNRTFMELKYLSGKKITSTQIKVLIVPLWNWNTESLLEIEEVESFNRTFMELKYHRSDRNSTYKIKF